MKEIYIPVLDTIAALYPFTLLLLTYILIELHAKDNKLTVAIWNVIKSCKFLKILGSWNSNKSLIQAFGTIYLLSFMKFIRIVSDIVVKAHVHNMEGGVEAMIIYSDPSVTLFCRRHLPLFILSAFILIFFLLPPIILLFLYPTKHFKIVNKCLKPRRVLTLKIFTDLFHGKFKDGTNGTRDYRPAAGLIFMIWLLIPVVHEIVEVCLNITFSWLVIFIPVAIILSIGFVIFEPYKDKSANISATVMLTIMNIAASIAATIDAYKFSTHMAVLYVAVLTLPHCVFYGYGIYRLVKWFREYAQTVYEQDHRQLLVQ